MHRLSDIAKIANLYSGSTYEEKHEAADYLDEHPEVAQTIANLTFFSTKGKESGKEKMQRTRHSKNIAATTKDMRDIAREAHRRGLNRRMKPAQFKLLDPHGTHIIAPKFFHDRADGKLVEMHCRCSIHLKLLGKTKAVELMMDVPMSFIEDYLTGQEKLELMDHAIAINAVENLDGKQSTLERKVEMINTEDLVMGNEATPNADKVSAEGNS